MPNAMSNIIRNQALFCLARDLRFTEAVGAEKKTS